MNCVKKIVFMLAFIMGMQSIPINGRFAHLVDFCKPVAAGIASSFITACAEHSLLTPYDFKNETQWCWVVTLGGLIVVNPLLAGAINTYIFKAYNKREPARTAAFGSNLVRLGAFYVVSGKLQTEDIPLSALLIMMMSIPGVYMASLLDQ